MDYGPVVQAILFAIFGGLTAILSGVIEPTYDLLFVPEMSPASAFAPLTGGGPFGAAVGFSDLLLAVVVDPLAILVIVAVGLLYLARAVTPSPRWVGLAPRLVIALLAANLVTPIATVLWDLAAAVYPVFYNYQGGAWQQYANLVGPGGISLSWDNGLLAFVVSLLLFTLVLLLALLVAFREALLAVLLVLLPLLTLLWAVPPCAGLARRAWSLFVEMTFLPCVLVIPLALAVGTGNVLLVLALFAVALGTPQLLSLAGTTTSHLGFPSSGFLLGGGLVRSTETAAGTGSQLVQGTSRAFSQGLREGKSSRGETGAVGGAAGGAKGAGAAGARATGPAGLVAWGAQQTVGRLVHRVGHQVGAALDADTPRAGVPGTSSPPARLPRAERIAGSP